MLSWASPASSAAILWPEDQGGNGHYYELMSGGPDDRVWHVQNEAAQALTTDGMHGHLATITSLAELTWITEHLFVPQLPLSSVVYLGGWNDGFTVDDTESCNPNEATLGSWHWITGEPWDYSAWSANEPSTSFGECTSEFALSYLYFWNYYEHHTGFNNLAFEYERASEMRLVEFDNYSVIDQPPQNPVAVEASSWGALKARFR